MLRYNIKGGHMWATFNIPLILPSAKSNLFKPAGIKYYVYKSTLYA